MVFESENFVHFCNCPNLTKNKTSVGDSKNIFHRKIKYHLVTPKFLVMPSNTMEFFLSQQSHGFKEKRTEYPKLSECARKILAALPPRAIADKSFSKASFMTESRKTV